MNQFVTNQAGSSGIREIDAFSLEEIPSIPAGTNTTEETSNNKRVEEEPTVAADFSYVTTSARIARYDDLRSAPRMFEIEPSDTDTFIENLAVCIYEQSHDAGGNIPYAVIRQVSENFIHARFREIAVSILDGGKTIRFADQGPGIQYKEQAQQPGFSSATEPMKRHIRGVGSGLPLAKEYLESYHGSITIEDNMGTGAVVTLHMGEDDTKPNIEYAPTEAYSQASFQGVPETISSFGTPVAPVEQRPSPASNGSMATKPTIPSTIPAVYAPYQQQDSSAASFYAVQQAAIQMAQAQFGPRDHIILPHLLKEGPLGITQIVNLTGIAQATVSKDLDHLEQRGLVEKLPNKKRTLTQLGAQVASRMMA